MNGHPPRFLDQVRNALRVRHYSLRSEKAYVGWIRRFILYHQKRHPDSMGVDEVNAFLTHLAVDGHVSVSTQNQALAALLFLYQTMIKRPLPVLDGVIRASKPKRLPVVMTREEVRAVLANLDGLPWIVGTLLYGTGMRLLECLRLRVKDIDFERSLIVIREAKGDRDRRTMLPAIVSGALRDHLQQVRALHVEDLAEGYGAVWLPHALERKYPQAPREWGWQYVFPASALSIDPRSGRKARHHLGEQVIQRAVRRASVEAGLTAHVPAFVCYAPAGRWKRHPNGAGVVGTCGRQDDHDLHACAQSGRRTRDHQSCRHARRIQKSEWVLSVKKTP